MGRPHRLLLAVAVALLAAASARAVAGSATGPTRPRGPVVPTVTTTTALAAPPAMSPPPPGSAALGAALVTPTDMGGYYRTSSVSAEEFLDSAPCLAALQPSAAQAGRAATALLGPDRSSVPTMVEVVASYRSSLAVFRSLNASIAACPMLRFRFGGEPLATGLQPLVLAPVGQADQAYQGTFSLAGVAYRLQIGVVLYASAVVTVIWIDTVPPSAAVMGNFASTLSVAIGKLA